MTREGACSEVERVFVPFIRLELKCQCSRAARRRISVTEHIDITIGIILRPGSG